MQKRPYILLILVLTGLLAAVSLGRVWAEDAAATEDTAQDNAQAGPADTAAADAPAAPDDTVAVQEPLSPLGNESDVPEDQKVQKGSIREKVSLDLRNIEVTEALRFLAQKGGINIAISKNVTGRVQLVLNEVPIADIMDIIFVTAGLAYEKHGDIYYIMSEAEYKDRYGSKFSDTRRVKVFRLKYAVPDQAFALLELLKSDIGKLLVDPESGTVLVMDTQDNINRMEAALAGLEQKRAMRVYVLRYAKAVDVETRLKAQLDSKKVGLITSDERTNQIIVETFPDRMKEIDDLVAALDQKTKEVLIDAKIVKITLTDDKNVGIEWEGLMKNAAGNLGTYFIGNHPLEPVVRTGKSFIDNFTTIAPTTNPPAGSKTTATENVTFGIIDGDAAFEGLLHFLQTLGETKVLSNPKLAVVNNQEAKIHVGEKQAYVTTTTTTGQTTTTTAESVTFVDVGIQLSVTPSINEDGYVTMKIKPEISSVTDFLVTPSGNKIPIIDSSLAETTVMVKDGVSIIIGGLRRDENTETVKKTPFLGDIPLLGRPFRSTATGKVHAELMILITPHIVTGDELVTGHERAGDKPFLTYTDYGGIAAGENVKARLDRAPR